jgi:hypothetical protein
LAENKTEQIDCSKDDFGAVAVPGVKMQNIFEEPRKFTLRGQLKSAFSGSSIAMVPIIIPAGNTDILYTCRKIYGLKLDIRKKKESVYTIKMFLRSVLGETKIYGMWFGTEKNIRKYYNGDEEISCYSLPKNYGTALVISDMGPEGSLIVSVEPFCKIL